MDDDGDDDRHPEACGHPSHDLDRSTGDGDLFQLLLELLQPLGKTEGGSGEHHEENEHDDGEDDVTGGKGHGISK